MKGGVALSQENSSILRFSLEESVWFQKGQEVADLLSISLDPNITIQENDQYITIQGSLELTGEYKRFNEDYLEEEEVFKAPKLIHSVMEREEGVCEFLHHFPVDITIPIARITSLDDIEVEVETFDYVFPERSCLNLTADLSIAGLSNNEEQEFDQEEEEIEEEELEFSYRGQTDPIEEEPVEIAVSPFQTVSPLMEEENRVPIEEVEDIYTPFEVEARKSPEASGDDWAENDSTVVPFFSEVDHEEEIPQYKASTQEKEMKVALFRNEKEDFSAEDVFQKPQHESSESKGEDLTYSHAEVEETEESSSSQDKEPKKKKGIFNKTKTLTFTEFFARKEEETHTKLKVCIVQHGDTLEKLSERYNVNIHSLLKENRLEVSQDVYEGQVLYIPVKFVEK
jgi:stage VI sporulation protein D